MHSCMWHSSLSIKRHWPGCWNKTKEKSHTQSYRLGFPKHTWLIRNFFHVLIFIHVFIIPKRMIDHVYTCTSIKKIVWSSSVFNFGLIVPCFIHNIIGWLCPLDINFKTLSSWQLSTITYKPWWHFSWWTSVRTSLVCATINKSPKNVD